MPSLARRFPFLLLDYAVFLAILAGGLGPGVLAVAVSVVFVSRSLVLWPPAGDAPAWLAFAIFVLAGLLTSVIGDRLLRSSRRPRQAHPATPPADAHGDTVQRALAASEARFRAAQNASLQPFTILEATRDAAGAIVDFTWVYANHAATHALGRRPGELEGRRLLHVLPEHGADLFTLYCRVVEHRTPEDKTVEYVADGISRWFRMLAVPLEDGVAAAFLDVTAEKRLGEELAARDAYKDHFLAVLAHELRQPLQAITIAARGLDDPSGDRAQVSRVLQRQVHQLSRLVSDLNDLTRIKQGRVHFEQQTFDVRDVIDAVADAFRAVLAQQEVRLIVRIPDEALPVAGDVARMQQALANLLQNAAHATPSGGTVEIAAHRRGSDIVICVRDDGAGIEPALLPRIFSLFVLKEGHDSARLGVGLALVHSIVARHHGTVEVRSEGPGRGTEFEITLRAAPVAAT